MGNLPKNIEEYALSCDPADDKGIDLLEAVYSNRGGRSFSVTAKKNPESGNSNPNIDINFSFFDSQIGAKEPQSIELDALAKLIVGDEKLESRVVQTIQQVGEALAERVKKCLAR